MTVPLKQPATAPLTVAHPRKVDRKAFLQAFDDKSAIEALVDLFAPHARAAPNG